jgi:diguanylate cyclase (GGDEF)-like protein
MANHELHNFPGNASAKPVLSGSSAPLMQSALQTALSLLIDETASSWGQDFFYRFVQTLSTALDIDHVLISVKTDATLTAANCYALWADGVLGEPFEYSLQDSACLRVLQEGKTLRCLHDASLHFPRNDYIVCMPAYCYLGVPINNQSGETIGLIAILDRQPLPDPLLVETVIELFKGRVSAELQRQQAEQALYDLAHRDSLTALPNRYAFLQALDRACIAQCHGEKKQLAVLFLDHDRFKFINDQWGHPFGDRVLMAIGDRLHRLTPKTGILSRFGGDEFVILIPQIQDQQEAIALAEAIQQDCAHPLDIDGQAIVMTASIGIAISHPHHQDTPDTLLRNADIAMYAAKARGNGTYKVFEAADYERIQHRSSLESALRDAIARHEFVVRYQPIFTLKTGQIIGFEALVTWQHPDAGLLFPGHFISLAEELGLITQIDHLILKQACIQLKDWQQQKLLSSDVYMSVNLSAKNLQNTLTLEYIERILTQSQLNPACLNLEITESDVMNNTKGSRFLLNNLRSRGVKISIDDFGTGYSSLSYLHQFPFSHLKIDQSFVAKLTAKSEQYNVVKTIILLAQNLGMTAIAEGIETVAQRHCLEALGCELGQGYLFAKPLFAPEATALLLTHNSTSQHYQTL